MFRDFYQSLFENFIFILRVLEHQNAINNITVVVNIVVSKCGLQIDIIININFILYSLYNIII